MSLSKELKLTTFAFLLFFSLLALGDFPEKLFEIQVDDEKLLEESWGSLLRAVSRQDQSVLKRNFQNGLKKTALRDVSGKGESLKQYIKNNNLETQSDFLIKINELCHHPDREKDTCHLRDFQQLTYVISKMSENWSEGILRSINEFMNPWTMAPGCLGAAYLISGGIMEYASFLNSNNQQPITLETIIQIITHQYNYGGSNGFVAWIFIDLSLGAMCAKVFWDQVLRDRGAELYYILKHTNGKSHAYQNNTAWLASWFYQFDNKDYTNRYATDWLAGQSAPDMEAKNYYGIPLNKAIYQFHLEIMMMSQVDLKFVDREALFSNSTPITKVAELEMPEGYLNRLMNRKKNSSIPSERCEILMMQGGSRSGMQNIQICREQNNIALKIMDLPGWYIVEESDLEPLLAFLFLSFDAASFSVFSAW